jgi:hypothetical protein
MICPLCQYDFNDKAACRGCGLSKQCALIKCPNCGYEFVEDSKIVSALSQFWKSWKKREKQEGI